jgi:hypothetical protein
MHHGGERHLSSLGWWSALWRAIGLVESALWRALGLVESALWRALGMVESAIWRRWAWWSALNIWDLGKLLDGPFI